MSDQDAQPQPPHSELATFGEELRREREIRGISLKEIADATKISKRFLEAIERNDHKTLPAPVFTRGFVREYARYLGLASDDIVNRYNYAAAGDDRIEKPPNHPVAPAAAEIPKKPRARRGIPPVFLRIDGNFVMLALIVVALSAAAWWAVQFKHHRDAEARAAETPIVTDSVAPKPARQPAPAPSPVNDDALRLVVDVTQESWVDLTADDKSVLRDTLKPGEHRTFEANEKFVFRKIGNANGLSLTLNEVKVPAPLGDGDEVQSNLTFDKASLQTLRSQTATQP
jgi:cytoskeletal protein RodZ